MEKQLMASIKLSVTIITYNEEKNIERCLQSVLEVADDIVVVDSFSTDKTEEICSRYPVRFIQHAFEGHIEQKNWAISQAKYPHVLSLDADEALSEVLKQSIITVKHDWQADGYTMDRLTNYCGKWIKHCGWYPDTKLRLVDSRKGSWGGMNPHDKYLMEKGAAIWHLEGDLLHYSYYTIAQHVDQIQKFTTINARMKHQKNKHIPVGMVILRFFHAFIKKYFFKLGFLDGYYGYVISVLSAYTTFVKDIKLRELNKKGKGNKAV